VLVPVLVGAWANAIRLPAASTSATNVRFTLRQSWTLHNLRQFPSSLHEPVQVRLKTFVLRFGYIRVDLQLATGTVLRGEAALNLEPK
jgi:hypothetical protein